MEVARGEPVLAADGRAAWWVGTCTNESHRPVVEGFLALGPDRVVRYASPAVSGILGWLPGEVLGTDVLNLTHPGSRPGLGVRLAHLLAHPGDRVEVDYRFRHEDGTYRRLEFRATNLLHVRGINAVAVTFWERG